MNSTSNAVQAKPFQQSLSQERVRILYTSIRAGLLTYYAWWVSMLLVLVLSGANTAGLIILASAIVAASFIQSKIQKAFFNAETIENESAWERRQVAVSSLEGLIVSVGTMLLLDLNQPLVVYAVAFLIVAAAFAGALSLVASIQTYYGWTLVLLLPLAIKLGLSGNSFYMIIAALWALGGASSAVLVANNLHKSFLRTLELRFENLDLLETVKHERNRAEQASRDKTRFLASASHDLRQPMHSIGLFSDALEHELDKPRQFELMNKMKASIGSMDELLYSLLDISQLDAGVVKTHIEPVLIRHILDKLMALFLPQAAFKQIDLQLECSAYAVKTDAALLENILRNLIANALKYTEQGSVLIKAEQIASNVTITIQDTGIGISKENQRKIFDEFYQAHNPERDRSKGLGLGLSIAARSCDLLGHKLSCESELGKGSTFTLTLEAADINAVKHASKTDFFIQQTLKATVLVIDDERIILEGMKNMLQRWGCDVLLAESESDALIQLQKNDGNVDLVIVDYRLRDEKLGTEAATAIRQAVSNPELPVIVITGDTGPEELINVQKEGYHILHKPVAPMRIRTLMQNLLKPLGNKV